MRSFAFTAAAAALLTFTTALPAQNTSPAPTSTIAPAPTPARTTKRQAPKPATEVAPGGGPDKVWVNTNSSVYHCPGDRFYGKTSHGRYMTEAAAKSAGGKGVGGKTCFAKQ